MPRSPRIIVAGGIYHVFARGNNKGTIFIDNIDRWTYLRLLTACFKPLQVRLFAYVLMSNHVHLVLQITEPNMDEAMHRLHGLYAHRFNRRHGRIGHAFNNRYRSRIIVEDAYLLEATCYVHLNPVEAGLVAHPLDYPWSSYRSYVEPPRPTQLVEPDPGVVAARQGLRSESRRLRRICHDGVAPQRHQRQKVCRA